MFDTLRLKMEKFLLLIWTWTCEQWIESWIRGSMDGWVGPRDWCQWRYYTGLTIRQYMYKCLPWVWGVGCAVWVQPNEVRLASWAIYLHGRYRTY